MTYFAEDYLGAIQLALACAASNETAITLISALVADFRIEPEETRPMKLFVDTVQALGGEYRLNQQATA